MSHNCDEVTLIGVVVYRIEPGAVKPAGRPGSAVAVPPALSVSPPTTARSPTTLRVREKPAKHSANSPTLTTDGSIRPRVREKPAKHSANSPTLTTDRSIRLATLLRQKVLGPLGLTNTVVSQTAAVPSPVLHAFSSERREALGISPGTRSTRSPLTRTRTGRRLQALPRRRTSTT